MFDLAAVTRNPRSPKPLQQGETAALSPPRLHGDRSVRHNGFASDILTPGWPISICGYPER